MADFETLVLTRDIACSPARLFHTMTDRDLRQKWSAPDNDSVIIIDQFDCRPGGREVIRCGPKEAPEFNTIGDFHVVSPDFLCFTETLMVGGQTISISLCSHEISESPGGSHLRVTLQITSLAGPDMFKDYNTGWSAALDNLAILASSFEQ
ncbi:MAG TPA: SRPBCC domain-containing protein [Paracoccus sp. (in: a-proteobacteria)]|uniref:SRPBCC domain-containing protein n=1 Tax=uncultured Paracoccus sp. TaxID=189685 RepID=UPI00260B4B95|nr:SRPBCC domain-containing protein [uncultured Paracoccus sp.]HMQ40049.1 SRPBCC domain-containing protein [Paracoccus sp. (in: a-proteobacteria)]HMR35297.1 SRPBCC domain-containing protein [Paracoccus sp. (in: a-proteobacteria)]